MSPYLESTLKAVGGQGQATLAEPRYLESERTPSRQGGAVFGAEESAPQLKFEALFVRYAPYVASIGLRLLGRRDEIDDLVQDVFLEAHRGLHRLKDPRAVKGWLATITVRQAGRRLRRRKLAHKLGWRQSEADYENVAGREASPEQRLHIARVYQALDRLPIKHRVPWVLRFIEGESLDQITSACGISRATAYRRIAAAHEAVRREVGHG
jgi:RNA polymerase sigma-70 factor (ECF subfamily)